jgi:hypothetical protein
MSRDENASRIKLGELEQVRSNSYHLMSASAVLS